MRRSHRTAARSCRSTEVRSDARRRARRDASGARRASAPAEEGRGHDPGRHPRPGAGRRRVAGQAYDPRRRTARARGSYPHGRAGAWGREVLAPPRRRRPLRRDARRCRPPRVRRGAQPARRRLQAAGHRRVDLAGSGVSRNTSCTWCSKSRRRTRRSRSRRTSRSSARRSSTRLQLQSADVRPPITEFLSALRARAAVLAAVPRAALVEPTPVLSRLRPPIALDTITHDNLRYVKLVDYGRLGRRLRSAAAERAHPSPDGRQAGPAIDCGSTRRSWSRARRELAVAALTQAPSGPRRTTVARDRARRARSCRSALSGARSSPGAAATLAAVACCGERLGRNVTVRAGRSRGAAPQVCAADGGAPCAGLAVRRGIRTRGRTCVRHEHVRRASGERRAAAAG